MSLAICQSRIERDCRDRQWTAGDGRHPYTYTWLYHIAREGLATRNQAEQGSQSTGSVTSAYYHSKPQAGLF